MPRTLYLIDGHAQVYRAFYAVEGLTAPDGRPTGAIFGFARMLDDILFRYQPDYVAAVFDAPGKNFRHARYPAYKATRKPTPPELKEQIPFIHTLLEGYRIPIYMLEGYEADDVLGTLAKQAETEGMEVVIVSGDKDCGQLLSEHISILDPQKDRLISPASFQEEKGIPPALLPDLMGLWGDTSDNIPGVPGIGEKIGCELIRTYGSLEALLEHADEIKGKRGEAIRAHREEALLSKELATINTHAPIQLDLEACRRRDPDPYILRPLFRDLGFTTLLHKLDSHLPPPQERREYILVHTAETFEAFLHAFRNESHWAIDTETMVEDAEASALDPMRAQLVGISISTAPRTGYYLAFRGPPGTHVLAPEALARLKPFLENPQITKTGQNLKYDMLVLRRAGIQLKGVVFDSLVASSLLDSGSRSHDLDTLAERYLHLHKIPTESLLGKGKQQIRMDEVPLEKIRDYACEDADVALRLEEVLRQELDRRGMWRLFEELELPLSKVLAEMQYNGIRVDAALLARQSEEVATILDALREEIYAMAGIEFNLDSPKQVAEVLFERLKMPIIRRLKTGPSTDEATLSELVAQGYELPSRLLDYRTYTKLKNTYLDALPKMIHPQTGRIHTTFSQTATATGRLSSSNPNLQNIPVRSEHGRAIRAAFIPEPGWKMLAADYSQIELRMLAHFCADEALRRAFHEGLDIHRVVAAEIYGVPPEAVTREQRTAAKAVNFGVLYGQTAHGLSQATSMTFGQARDFIERYFARFPRIRTFIETTVATARERGYVETLLGRRREIPELRSSNKANRARGEREAVNTLIQGSAADLIKTAMVHIHARLQEELPQARMLLQIHDELLFEAPPDGIEDLREMVVAEMEHALPLAVPLVVEVGVGENWLEIA